LAQGLRRFRPGPEAKGVTVDNPNDITVTHEFSTVEAAQAFVKSEELKQAMQNAGVVGAPNLVHQ
jgi:hypothetical protein